MAVGLLNVGATMPPKERLSYIVDGMYLNAQYCPISQENTETMQDTYKRICVAYSAELCELGARIIEAESNWNEKAQSSLSSAKGLAQFTNATWEENCIGDPLNGQDNIKCLLKLLNKGQSWRWFASMDKWTDCSCVRYVRSLGLDLPPIDSPKDLKTNTNPCIGCGVLLSYNGLPHIGLIMDIRPGGVFARHQYLSKGKCITDISFFAWENIKGFYYGQQN